MKWVMKPEPASSTVEELSNAINVNKTIAGILVQRGITSFEEAKQFFRPSLEDLHDPFLLKDMDKAIDRINSAIAAGEKIMVYGDYDVDGTTAVSLVYGFLSETYPNLMHYVPDRYKEGYGVSMQGIDVAGESNVKLIISLDCGIKAHNAISYAKEKGIDFIVCDHHLPGDELPDAVAILDAKQKDCNYPYKELCGCGVGFKLCHAFSIQNSIPEETIFGFLDLVAVGTCSDIVPLTGENRILVYHGLKRINSQPRTGLMALIEIAGFKNDLNVSNVVFGIGPRINAAGRMDHAKGAVDLLLTKDVQLAHELAMKINERNVDRRETDKSMTAEALQLLNANPQNDTRKTTVLYQPNWHKGVIGIVASRCIEKFHRPTILLTKSNGKVTGSARSVPGYDIHEAIGKCSHLLDQFGGHAFAAGLTMQEENVEEFKMLFEKTVSESIPEELLIAKINIDSALEPGMMTDKFMNLLKQMGPFGPGNMQPVFVTENVHDSGSSRIVKEDHVKLTVSKDSFSGINGIAFGQAAHFDAISSGKSFDLCYTLEENHFNGNTTLQLNVKDIQIKDS